MYARLTGLSRNKMYKHVRPYRHKRLDTFVTMLEGGGLLEYFNDFLDRRSPTCSLNAHLVGGSICRRLTCVHTCRDHKPAQSYNTETMLRHTCFLALMGACSLVSGGDILFWSAFESKSRLFRIKPLVLELTKRGHHVTWVRPNFVDHELDDVTRLRLVQCPNDLIVKVFKMLNSRDIFEGQQPPPAEVLDIMVQVSLARLLIASIEFLKRHTCCRLISCGVDTLDWHRPDQVLRLTQLVMRRSSTNLKRTLIRNFTQTEFQDPLSMDGK